MNNIAPAPSISVHEHISNDHTDVVVHVLVGLAAIVFSGLYLASDVIEVIQDGFSNERLVLTYLGEASLPLVVLGLYAVQRRSIGLVGLIGAIAYAYSYIFFTSTVVHALVADSPDYAAVNDAFGGWMTLHGALMMLGALAFGAATVRAGVLPRWTGVCLALGGVLVAAASTSSELVRTLAEAVPAAAFIGMGLALVGGTRTALVPRSR